MSQQDYQGELERLWQENLDLREEVQEYRDAITWETSCFRCSDVLSDSYEQYVRAEQLQERTDTMVQRLDSLSGIVALSGRHDISKEINKTIDRFKEGESD